jgi:hypothetical protein
MPNGTDAMMAAIDPTSSPIRADASFTTNRGREQDAARTLDARELLERPAATHVARSVWSCAVRGATEA